MKTPLILLGLLSTLALSWTMDPTWNLTTLDAVGNVITLHNASDFIELSNIMKREVLTDFAGSTIVLDSDIDFTNYSDQFNPIARNYYTLRAKFDGRGHTISNLHMNSNWRFVGLFGMTNGTSFKNLVVDASCTIHNNHFLIGDNYTAYAGGIIGYIYPEKKDANSIIENLVNMAKVSFSGGIGPESILVTSYTFVGGGVIGYFKPRKTDTIIRNCVNYGEVLFAGKTIITSLSGILGAFLDISNTVSTHITINNCANYGNLVHTGETSDMLGIGGIAGAIFSGVVERCMNFGIFIANQKVGAGSKIIGGGTEQLTIKDCIWTQESDTDNPCIYSYSGIDVIISNARRVVFDEKELTDLNDWVDTANDEGDIDEEDVYHRWMALHLDGGSVGNASGALLPAMIGYPIIDPTKEGHTFAYWCLDDDCTEGQAAKEDVLNETTTELYAMWSLNSYIVTFYFGNGTFVNKTFKYNEPIVPPDMTGVKDFYGWDIPYSGMPASDIMILPKKAPEKGSNVGAIVGGTIGGVAGLAIIVLIILIVVRIIQDNKRKEEEVAMRGMRLGHGGHSRDGRGGVNGRMDGYGRGDMGVRSRNGVRGGGFDGGDMGGSDTSSEELSACVALKSMFPEDYIAPNTLLDALIETGLDAEKAQVVADTCTSNAMDVSDEGLLDEGLTCDDAAAIGLYTYDIGVGEIDFNPCALISTTLIGIGEPEKVRGILCVLMRALRKLPVVRGKTLYRAVRDNVRRDVYKNGAIVMWPAPASTSPDMNSTKKFLTDAPNDINESDSDDGSSSESEARSGTLFIISNGFGYNIQPYSLFPGKEILLEPERRFQVESVTKSDVTIVNLKMLETPLSLPHIFGEGTATKSE